VHAGIVVHRSGGRRAGCRSQGATMETNGEPDAHQVLQGESGMALRPEETHVGQTVRKGPQTVLSFIERTFDRV